MNELDKTGIKKLIEDQNIEGLISAMTNKNMDIRRMAAGALGTIGNDKAVKPLITALNDTTDYPVVKEPLQIPCMPIDARNEVALALGKIGGDEALEALQSAAASGNEEKGLYHGMTLKQAALKALSELGVGNRLNEGTIVDELKKGPINETVSDQALASEESEAKSQTNPESPKAPDNSKVKAKKRWKFW